MADSSGLVYIGGVFFFLLFIYCVHVQFRRRRYRLIASELGADYQSQGPFKTGKIAGVSNHRRYVIKNEDGSRGSGMWTVVEMQCANRGVPLEFRRGFFKSFPNWKCAVLLDEKYRIAVQGLFQEFALLDYAFLRKGSLRIEQDAMVFTIGGIVKQLEEIRQIISVLTGVADRIESEPIGDGREDQKKNPTPAGISVVLGRRGTSNDL